MPLADEAYYVCHGDAIQKKSQFFLFPLKAVGVKPTKAFTFWTIF